MADKIVQLENKDGDNIFPVAGALKSGSVSTSTINDAAVTAAKIAAGAVTAEKMNLATSTQTITWKNNDNTVGTTTCTMIPLDENGLTLCISDGVAWANNSSSPGTINIKGSWGTAPNTLVGGIIDGCFAEDTASYKTYGKIGNRFDLWIEKTASGTRNILVQIMCLAYFGN